MDRTPTPLGSRAPHPLRRVRATLLGAAHAFLVLASLAPPAGAQTAAPGAGKREFVLPALRLQNGRELTSVRIGYETWGRLNDAGDNAIFVARHFAATAHAAGRAAGDASPGYWDAIIGPGKAIDTDRYFVVSSDGLANIWANAPATITTGPASIDPATGRRYGATFPVFQIADMVDLDRALLASLGVRHLQAVAGASMGSMQAFEWSVRHPNFVSRVIAVLPIADVDAFMDVKLETWGLPIRRDPAWLGGSYDSAVPPRQGLAEFLKVQFGDVSNSGWRPDLPPADAASLDRPVPAVAMLERQVARSVDALDANSVLYNIRAMQLFTAGGGASLEDGLARARAAFLILPAESDVLFPPLYARRAAEILRRQGRVVTYREIAGAGGHSDGVNRIESVAGTIATFLE